MKIAVPYKDGEVFGHFGHTAVFMVYDTDGEKVLTKAELPVTGSGHAALTGLLAGAGVDTVICGGAGAGARQAMAAAGMTVYGGVTGSADAAVENLLAGRLAQDLGIASCGHDHCGDHEDGHHCGGHEDGHHCGCHGEH